MTGTDVPPGYEICAIPDGEFATTNGPLHVCLTERGLRFKFRAENKQSVLINASGLWARIRPSTTASAKTTEETL